VRIVFLGTPRAAVPSLRALIDAGHEVVRVVTQPDRPAGRRGRPLPGPVKIAAAKHGLDLIQPARVRNAAFREAIAECRPDLLVVVAYGRILTRAVLDLPRLGAVNLHYSLLPEYRGAAPVQWALARGEIVTGVTTMLMNEQLDEGDVLLQREVEILAGEHAPALERRLSELGSGVLVETLLGLESGALTPREQDHDAATFAPLLTRVDGEIDPALTAAEIEGRVRGFDPWPGAWVAGPRRRLRIMEAEALESGGSGEPPGTVLDLETEGLVLSCGEGSRLLVRKLQPEGGRAISARDAVNGRLLQPGDRIEVPPRVD